MNDNRNFDGDLVVPIMKGDSDGDGPMITPEKKEISTLEKMLEALKELKAKYGEAIHGKEFHRATIQKRHGMRHRPYTKPPMTGESKTRRKMAAKSRRINRKG